MPTTWLSVLLFIVAIAPGLLFDLGSTSRLVRAKESAFHEIARITLASLVFSGTAMAFAVLAHRRWPQTFLNLDQAIRGGWGYIREHQAPAAASLTLVVGVSLTAAWAVNLIWTVRVHGWGKPWMRSKSAWSVVFKPRGVERGTWVLATAALSDGSVVRGRVTEFSADLEHEDRELVLAPPITIRPTGGDPKERTELAAVVVGAGQVTRLQVEYRPPDNPVEQRPWSRLAALATAHGPAVGAVMIAAALSAAGNAWVGGVAGVLVAIALRIAVARLPAVGSAKPSPGPDPQAIRSESGADMHARSRDERSVVGSPD